MSADSTTPTSNVVPLKPARARDKSAAEAALERRLAKAEAAATRDRESKERRFASIDAAICDRKKIIEEEDRIIVAEHLFEILDRLGKGKKGAVLRAANMGAQGDSTKQLFNYTLPRAEGPQSSARDNRIKKLSKQANKYKLLAEKAAEKAGWDRKDIVIELFQGSSYSGYPSNLPDYLFALNEDLNKLRDWLLRETRISWYYEKLQEHMIWDDWGNFVTDTPVFPTKDYFNQFPTKDYFNQSSSLTTFYGPVIPGVLLYRQLAAKRPVDFVSAEGMDVEQRYDFETKLFDDHEISPNVPIEHLVYRVYFDIRLGIVPIGNSGKIALAFDQRRFGELWKENIDDDGQPVEEFRAYSTLTSYGPGGDDVWDECYDYYKRHPFRNPVGLVESYDDANDKLGLFGAWLCLKASDDDSVAPYELEKTTPDTPKGYCQDQFIEEVGFSTCAKYLARKYDPKKVKCAFTFSDTVLECPGDTIAARIETALYEGQLETSLKKEIEHRCSLLDSCLRHRRASIKEKRQRMYSRWGVSGGDTND